MYGAVLHFWFEETDRKFHFNASPAFDAEIRERFEELAISQAARVVKGPHPWEIDADGALALIILLDQFPRNMYRGTTAAFTWDGLALGVTKRAVDAGHDLKIAQDRRAFIYMPLMHSEALEDQDRMVALADQRLDDDSTLFHAKAHRKLIARFGRFPHRNEILQRTSTAEERQYLKDGGYTP
ncbi:MAG: DUF924 domain-containing protein [Hellea sp.]|nr:DUF924 domain-containing protein [Hellea sp.]